MVRAIAALQRVGGLLIIAQILALSALAQTSTAGSIIVNACSDVGSTDTYACSLPIASGSYVDGQVFWFKANTSNTGSASINFNSLGAKTIVKVTSGVSTPLADNDIRAGQWINVMYDGTNMQMLSVLGNAASGGSGDFSSNTSTSVDSEVVVFNGTAGKTGKRASGTGVAHLTSGVLSASNVTEAEITTADNTTNNVTSTKHGLAPKSPADATLFLNGAATPAYTRPTGYTLHVQALTSSPTDAQTIFFGNLPKAPVTTAANSRIFIRKAGTIKIAEIYCFSGTAGTAENWSVNIRLNNTTDTLVATVGAATSERIFSNTGLNITVAAGDYIEIKVVNPTWVTNPLTAIFGGWIYVE